MKPFVACLVIVVIAGVIASQVHLVPPEWVVALDRVPIKALLGGLAFVLVANLGLALYSHFVLPSSKKVVLRVLGFVLTTGGTLIFIPYLSSNLKSADIKAQIEAYRSKDTGQPDQAIAEVAGKITMLENNASEDSKWFLMATMVGSIILVVIFVLIDGMQAYWARELEADLHDPRRRSKSKKSKSRR